MNPGNSHAPTKPSLKSVCSISYGLFFGPLRLVCNCTIIQALHLVLFIEGRMHRHG
uniref:Uncharacterized protein n=1 Tax=Arundo donax TaxID=35708 RepID=A0A0A9BD38_ARUDO